MRTQMLRMVCRALIGVVLLAQLAVSAYACPGQSFASAAAINMTIDGATAAPSRLMPDCADMAAPMDPEFAALCAEHCHHGQQSDHAATLNVPVPCLSALYVTPLAPEPGSALRPAAAAAASALAGAFPPHAILHCCFRI